MVKLHASASEEVPLVKVVFFERWTAQPAPLILTFWARHMVAPFFPYFSYPRFALFAVNDVALCFCPLFVVIILNLFTCQPFVVGLSTIKANLGLAFGANLSRLTNRCFAIRCWTPFKWGVKVNLDVDFVNLVLFVVFINRKLLNILVFESSTAIDSRTRYTQNNANSYIRSKVLLHTARTDTVTTF